MCTQTIPSLSGSLLRFFAQSSGEQTNKRTEMKDLSQSKTCQCMFAKSAKLTKITETMRVQIESENILNALIRLCPPRLESIFVEA